MDSRVRERNDPGLAVRRLPQEVAVARAHLQARRGRHCRRGGLGDLPWCVHTKTKQKVTEGVRK